MKLNVTAIEFLRAERVISIEANGEMFDVEFMPVGEACNPIDQLATADFEPEFTTGFEELTDELWCELVHYLDTNVEVQQFISALSF